MKIDKNKILSVDGILTIVGCLVLLMAVLGFGESGSFYPIMGVIAMAVGLFIVLRKEESSKPKGKNKRDLLWFLPFLVFLAFQILSLFWASSGVGIVIFPLSGAIAMLGFLLLGLTLRRNALFNPRNILLFLFGALVIVTFVSFIYNMFAYGPFYMALHADDYYFFQGKAYPYANEFVTFNGFSFERVDSSFGTIGAYLLASLLGALFFIKPKEEKTLFWSIVGFGGFGLLYLIMLPKLSAIVMLFFPLALSLFIKFFAKDRTLPKWEKNLSYVLLGAVVLVVFFMTVVATSGTNIYAGNPLLNKVFNNGRLCLGINQTINAIFKSNTNTFNGGSLLKILFGMPTYSVNGFSDLSALLSGTGNFYLTESMWGNGMGIPWTEFNLNTFEFSALMETGLLGFLGLCVFIVFEFINLRKYLHADKNIVGYKMLIVLFLFSFLIYKSVFSSTFPSLDDQYYRSPFMRNSLWLIVLFLIGFSYCSPFKPITSLEDYEND